jgi:endonuclease YncB( thermonuclease family)
VELVVLLLIIGVVFALRGRSVSRRRGGSVRPVTPVYRPNPTSLSRRRIQPGRFDAQTAKPDIKHRQLKGRAYIIDGDSLVIQKTQVRLFGVDAPELNHPYGQKAKWALHGFCKGQTVRAEVIALDAHGRTVAKCYLEDGRDLSAEMVKCGLAID